MRIPDSRGNLTIQDFLGRYPRGASLMVRLGLEKFTAPEVVRSLGAVLKLRTVFNAKGLALSRFLEALDAEAVGAEETGDFGSDYAHQRNLRMLGLMPCGMKMPFKRKLEGFLEQYEERERPRFLVEGNVNHELSYYPYIDTLRDVDELPDLIVSSDINAFFHHGFIGADAFETFPMPTENRDFAGLDYPDPEGRFTMLSANLLVIVVNRRLLGELPVPRAWEDLLEPRYENTVTMRGSSDFFCSGVLLPLLQRFGVSGVRAMARSVTRGLHPAEMVKEIDGGRQGSPFYVMPLFFARRLKDPECYQLVFPQEGAMVSPVFLLVKTWRHRDAQRLAAFVTGHELGQFCADAGFPSLRGDVENRLPPEAKLWWMGWEFLRARDPLRMKREVSEIFAEKFPRGGK